jgi:hypothetical protein
MSKFLYDTFEPPSEHSQFEPFVTDISSIIEGFYTSLIDINAFIKSENEKGKKIKSIPEPDPSHIVELANAIVEPLKTRSMYVLFPKVPIDELFSKWKTDVCPKPEEVAKIPGSGPGMPKCLFQMTKSEQLKPTMAECGCAINTMAFLGMITIEEACKRISKKAPINTYTGMNEVKEMIIKRMHIEEPLEMTTLEFANKPRNDPDRVWSVLLVLSVLNKTFNKAKINFNSRGNTMDPCVFVYEEFSRDGMGEDGGHSLLFTLYKGDVYMFDPQLLRTERVISHKGITALKATIWKGLGVFTSKSINTEGTFPRKKKRRTIRIRKGKSKRHHKSKSKRHRKSKRHH